MNDRRGSVMILVSVALIGFFAVTAVAVDIGRVYVDQRTTQATAESAAYAGGAMLAKKIGERGLANIGSCEIAAVQAEAMRIGTANGLSLETSQVVVAGTRVYVTGRRTVEYSFAKVIGFENKEVGGNAFARVGSDGRPQVVSQTRYNVMPYGMPLGTVNSGYSVEGGNVVVSDVADFTPGNNYVVKLGGVGGSYVGGSAIGSQVLIEMGTTEAGVNLQSQSGYQQAYGMAYSLAATATPVKWLLNYKGGSFMFDLDDVVMGPTKMNALKTSGVGSWGDAGFLRAINGIGTIDGTAVSVAYKVVDQASAQTILSAASKVITMTRAPRIGLYNSGTEGITPDPIKRSLQRAGIAFTEFYDTEVLTAGYLTTANFDWIHLHHEDFTGGMSLSTVPLITVSDNIGTGTTGPAGGTVTVSGAGWGSFTTSIQVKFNGVVQTCANTSTYASDQVSADGLTITAGDYGYFEVTFTAPSLAPGVYTIMARNTSGTKTSNNVSYSLVDASLSPLIAVTDSSGTATVGLAGDTAVVAGYNFTNYQTGITVQFNGTVMTLADTGALTNDVVAGGGGSVQANGNGEFNVAFTVPTLDSGDYVIQGFEPTRSSNQVSYTIEAPPGPPTITVFDTGVPLTSGPVGERVTVRGSGFTASQSNIEIRFNGSAKLLSDTATYSGDAVEPDTIYATADSYGRFEVTFYAPSAALAVYGVDAAVGAVVIASGSYTLDAAPPPSIAVTDTTGDPSTGPAATAVTVTGLRFNPGQTAIRIVMDGTTFLTATDSPGDSGDDVVAGEVTASSDGRFTVTVTIPGGTSVGAHTFTAEYPTSQVTGAATYTVESLPPAITISDGVGTTSEGPSFGTLTITGSNFPAGQTGINVSFDGTIMAVADTATYANDAASGQTVTADANGFFSVTITVPLTLAGVYPVRAQFLAQQTALVNYTVSVTESLQLSAQSNFSTSDNSFLSWNTVYVKVVSNQIVPGTVTTAQAFIRCNYHTGGDQHTGNTFTLTNNGDGTYTGSFDLNAYASKHNGTWTAYATVTNGTQTYSPNTTFSISGITVSQESTIISKNASLNTDDYGFGPSQWMYVLAGSNVVDCTILQSATVTLTCAKTGHSHTTGAQNMLNLLTGAYYGWIDLASVASLHIGRWNLAVNIQDTLGRTYAYTRQVTIYPASGNSYLISQDPMLINTTGTAFTRDKDYHINGTMYIEVYAPTVVGTITTKTCQVDIYKSGGTTHRRTQVITLTSLGNNRYSGSVVLSSMPKNPSGSTVDNTKIGDGDFENVTIQDGSGNSYTPSTMDLDVRQSSPYAGLVPEALGWMMARYVESIDGPVREIARAWREHFDPPTAPAPAPGFRGLPPNYPAWARAALMEQPTDSRAWYLRWFGPGPAWAVYTGKYNVVHAIRDFVVSGGYMMCACYATETIDYVLARDSGGNFIGYGKTLAFTGFAGSIDDNDVGNISLIDQTDTQDSLSRPLLLTQDHMWTLNGFGGQTNSFGKAYCKTVTGEGNQFPVTVLAKIDANSIKSLCAPYYNGFFTMIAGHEYYGSYTTTDAARLFRLYLNNILSGTLSATAQAGSGPVNYGILDWNNSNSGDVATEESEYGNEFKLGHSTTLNGEILTTGFPGDRADALVVDTVQDAWPTTSSSSQDYLNAHDLDFDPGPHGSTTYTVGSSRYVLVPIVATRNLANTATVATQGINRALNAGAGPGNIYKTIHRDKVRVRGYALFFLDPSSTAARDGEVRGTFCGWLK